MICTSLVLLDFNSIKVQLERAFCDSLKSWVTFQFHKGTIRTKMEVTDSRYAQISIP